MNIAAIILNYNDSTRCVEQAKKLVSFQIFSKVIVVDNKSKDEERAKLDAIKDIASVIYAEENRGYGAGNNLGLRFLKDYNVDFVFLINNDIIVEKESIEKMLIFIQSKENVAAVTCPMIERGKLKRNFYDFPNLKNSFFDCVTIEASDFDNFKNSDLNGKIEICKKMSKKCHSIKFHDNHLYSDFIRESCTIYNYKHFEKIGFFDEDFFLYEEGPSICMNLKKIGLNVAVLLDTIPFIHDHKGTFFNRKTFAAIKKSRIHFFKKYLKYPWYKTILIKIFYINVYLK